MIRKILNKVLNKWEFRKWSHVSWLSTVLFNLRCFEFKTALKLPIYIYNGVDVISLNKVILDAKDVYRGMIRIGCCPAKAHNHTKLIISGTVIFHGSADIWGGTIIEASRTLEFGENVMLAESCKIMCCHHIVFGNHIRVGYESTFMDTDYHYIISTENHKVRPNKAPVTIGDGTWISSNCKIMKGAVIPPKSIIGGGSLVNKDFSQEAPCQIFVGTPAKPVKGGFRRIFNVKMEDELNSYFAQHPEERSYVVEADDLDKLCYTNFFRNR